VRPDCQGRGIAKRLLSMTEAWAINSDAKRLMAWSDSRFKKAHGMYQARGYVKQTETRILGDVSNTTEFLFVKTV
jgi:GNAT superfamily N-acetyltransferase